MFTLLGVFAFLGINYTDLALVFTVLVLTITVSIGLLIVEGGKVSLKQYIKDWLKYSLFLCAGILSPFFFWVMLTAMLCVWLFKVKGVDAWRYAAAFWGLLYAFAK